MMFRFRPELRKKLGVARHKSTLDKWNANHLLLITGEFTP